MIFSSLCFSTTLIFSTYKDYKNTSLIPTREKTDIAISNYKNHLNTLNNNILNKTLEENLKNLLQLRKEVDDLNAKDFPSKMTRIVKKFIDLSVDDGFAISTLTTSYEIYDYILVSYYLINMREATGLLRANINTAFSQNNINNNQKIKAVFENLCIFNFYLHQFENILEKYQNEDKINQIIKENQTKIENLNKNILILM